MSKKFRKQKDVVWRLLNAIGIGGPLELRKEGGLKNDGWFLSFETKKSVDVYGNPIPWFTYSSLKFIESKLKNSFSVFEYGSGSSTVWFSKRVSDVTSVEHDQQWYKQVKSNLPKNCELHLIEKNENDKYSTFIRSLNKYYDIIIIDGIDRVKCCKIAPDYLKNGGVIIFDNSEREEYNEGISYLSQKGFKELFFIGNLPVVSHYSKTSIYYKEDNIFNL